MYTPSEYLGFGRAETPEVPGHWGEGSVWTTSKTRPTHVNVCVRVYFYFVIIVIIYLFFIIMPRQKKTRSWRRPVKKIGLGARRRRHRLKGQFISIHCRRSSRNVRRHTHEKPCPLPFNLLTEEDGTYTYTHLLLLCPTTRKRKRCVFSFVFFFVLRPPPYSLCTHTPWCTHITLGRPVHTALLLTYITRARLLCIVSVGRVARCDVYKRARRTRRFFCFLNGLHYNTDSDNSSGERWRIAENEPNDNPSPRIL